MCFFCANISLCSASPSPSCFFFLLLLGFYPSLPYINSLNTGGMVVCVCVFVHAYVCVLGGSLSNFNQALASWRSLQFAVEGTERGCLWSRDIYPWFSQRNARLSHHRCRVFPAMHPSLTSNRDKSHYTGVKYPSRCAQPPTPQNRVDLFPQQTGSLGRTIISSWMLTNTFIT